MTHKNISNALWWACMVGAVVAGSAYLFCGLLALAPSEMGTFATVAVGFVVTGALCKLRTSKWIEGEQRSSYADSQDSDMTTGEYTVVVEGRGK